MARKPCEKTCIDNVLKYGVGGINIKECRVPCEDANKIYTKPIQNIKNKNTNILNNSKIKGTMTDDYLLGRYPANLIHDGSDEVKSIFPETKSSGGATTKPNFKTNQTEQGVLNFTKLNAERIETDYVAPCDSGNASRYFYCSKTSAKDRDEGLEDLEEKQCPSVLNTKNGSGERLDGAKTPIRRNTHPTVKPTELMQYLVRLVAPKNAIILDPFMGSGSTGKAVAYEKLERNKNYSFIGIEKEKEYIEIAQKRIDYVIKKMGVNKDVEIN